MSVKVHIQAHWSEERNKFSVTLQDVENFLTEDEFESFIQNLRDPIELDGIRLKIDGPGVAQAKEYFELVLESYKNWKAKQ